MFRTQGKRGKTNKRITVFSNDPVTPKLFLSLKGEIVLEVETTPPSLAFADITVGGTAVQKAALRITVPNKKFAGVTSDDPRFTAKLIPGDTPDKAEVEVTFLGSKTQEHIATGIKISLEGDQPSETNLPVRVNVVGNLRYPRQIFLMQMEDSFNTRDIDIASRSGKPFQIKSATDSGGVLKLDYPRKAAKEARITASVLNPKMEVKTSIRGTINVQTTDLLDSTFEIGYTISKRRSTANLRDQVARARRKNGALPRLDAAKGSGEKKAAPVQ